MREDDLLVLLSERAASEIHKKWCDTLKVFSLHIRSTCMYSMASLTVCSMVTLTVCSVATLTVCSMVALTVCSMVTLTVCTHRVSPTAVFLQCKRNEYQFHSEKQLLGGMLVVVLIPED